MTKLTKHTAYFLSLVIFLTIPTNILNAQTNESLENERRKAEAEAREAEAKARTAEAQARSAEAKTRKDELANRKAELELLSAKTTVQGKLIESDISAYKAVSCAATDIKADVARLQNQIDTLMIYSPEFAETVSRYSALMGQLRILKRRYERAFEILPNKNLPGRRNTSKEVEAFTTLDSVINPVKQFKALTIDMLSLFKTDVKVEGKIIKIGKEEFIAEVVKGLNVEVYYPEKIIPLQAKESSEILAIINDLAEYRIKSENILDSIKQKKARLEIAYSSSANTDDESTLRSIKASFDELSARLPALNALYDGTISQFFAPADVVKEEDDSRENINTDDIDVVELERTIIDYMRAEIAYKYLSSSDKSRKYWLDVNVTKAGSNQRNKSSPVVDVFTGGQRLSFSGGAIVSYRIFNSDGRMLASDTILTYVPFKRSKNIAKYECQKVKGFRD